MSVCRGCAGTGISPSATPREAQAAQIPIYMVKRWPSEYNGVKSTGQVHADASISAGPAIRASQDGKRQTRAHARVDAWEGIGGIHKGRLAFSGPLLHVIEHVKQRLADGYEIEPGSVAPDPALLCEWCGGTGQAGEILTAHSMLEALEMGGQR